MWLELTTFSFFALIGSRLSSDFLSFPLKLLIQLVIFCLILKFIYQTSLATASFIYLIWLSSLACNEALVAFITQQLEITNKLVIGQHLFFRWELYLASHLSLLLFILILSRLIIHTNPNSGWRELSPIIVVCLAITFILVVVRDPIDGTIAQNQHFGIVLSSLVLLVASFYVTVAAKSILALKEQEHLKKIQLYELTLKLDYYEEKRQDEDRIRQLYHDFKNQLLVLKDQSKSSFSKDMLETLQERLSSYEAYYHTGNDIVDIILRDKLRLAKQNNIDVEVNLNLLDSQFINSLDIIALFGNAIDNAIEANLKLPETNRYISLKANRFNDFLSIAFENNSLPVDLTMKTTKEDDFFHGFGLSNIKDTINQYEGDCQFHYKNGQFILNILIPIP